MKMRRAFVRNLGPRLLPQSPTWLDADHCCTEGQPLVPE